MSEQLKVLDSGDFRRTIQRMSFEILEKNRGAEEIVLIGIQKKGVFLADRLAQEMSRIEQADILRGSINISMYRDDYGTRVAKTIGPSDVPFNVDRRVVIIADDVLYTGRSFRAAIEAIFDLGRPAAIQLAVMIDRGHRELPIQADYVGRQIPTAKTEQIEVVWAEEAGEDSVYIVKDK